MKCFAISRAYKLVSAYIYIAEASEHVVTFCMFRGASQSLFIVTVKCIKHFCCQSYRQLAI